MESRAKVEQHGVCTHFSKDPIWDLFEDENNEGFLQKTCWYSRINDHVVIRSHPSLRTLWSAGFFDHQNFPFRARRGGTIFGNSVVTIQPVQNKHFSGNPENPDGVLGVDEERRLHLHWQFLGIWQVLRGVILESLYVNATQIGNKWDCWESSTQSERNICSIVAIRSGWKNGGWIPWSASVFCAEKSGSLVWWEDTKWKAVRNAILLVQWYRSEQWSNITLFLRRTCRDHINLVLKSCQVYSSVMLCTREAVWKGDIMVADIETLEQMDASELHARRLNAKEVLTLKISGNFRFPVADGTVKNFGRELRLKTSTFTREAPERGEEHEGLWGESDEPSSPTPLQDDSTRDDAEATNDFWTITGNFIYRHRGSLSHIVRAETYSYEVHWRYQNHTHVTWCIVGKTYWGLLERRWRKRIIRCMDRLHKIHFVERKATW